MLLVLGCCFFFGGLKHKEQHFNSTSAVANMSLLLLSSLALVLPTPLSHATVRKSYSKLLVPVNVMVIFAGMWYIIVSLLVYQVYVV